MLKELQIQNFKAWADTGRIRMAPLTIFCGNNSSGKSSIAQFLLMLKQTVESYDRQRVLHFGDHKSSIDLGAYKDVIHRHEEARRLKFGFTFDTDSEFKISDATTKKVSPFSDIAFDAEVRFDGKSPKLVSFNYRMFGEPDSMRFTLSSSTGNKYKLGAEGYKLTRRIGRKWDPPQPENFFGFPDEAVAYYQNTGFLPDLSLAIKNLFKSIYYVGPLREHPLRTYQFSGDTPPHVGEKGESAINALLAAKESKRALSAGHRKKKVPFEELIASYLQRMGLIHSFRVVPIVEGRKEFEVRLKVHKDSSEVLITDVGFGISQIMPVIVQCFYVPSRSILFFEQPEIHLHPSVQSHLGDLFIDATRMREEGRDRKTQIIVESHSEHLIRRIQRRIAEGEIKPEDVAIYFIHHGKDGAVMEPLEIDLFGNVNNWPDNFFGDELEDLAAMTKAARERKMKGDG